MRIYDTKLESHRIYTNSVPTSAQMCHFEEKQGAFRSLLNAFWRLPMYNKRYIEFLKSWKVSLQCVSKRQP